MRLKPTIILFVTLIFGCNNPIKKYPKIQIGDICYNNYAGYVEKVIIVDTNSKGVFIKRSWYYGLDFVSYDSFFGDNAFKIAGHVNPKMSPLRSLKKMDEFRIDYGGSVETFIVKEVDPKHGLICTATDWLWEASVVIHFNDADNVYYKYIGVYKSKKQ